MEPPDRIRLNPDLWCERYWLHTFPWARRAKAIIAIIGKVAQSFSELCCCFGLFHCFLRPKVAILNNLVVIEMQQNPKDDKQHHLFNYSWDEGAQKCKSKPAIITNHPNTEKSPPSERISSEESISITLASIWFQQLNKESAIKLIQFGIVAIGFWIQFKNNKCTYNFPLENINKRAHTQTSFQRSASFQGHLHLTGGF